LPYISIPSMFLNPLLIKHSIKTPFQNLYLIFQNFGLSKLVAPLDLLLDGKFQRMILVYSFNIASLIMDFM
jgi:hypothetical protein